jgi:hypothetical protein
MSFRPAATARSANHQGAIAPNQLWAQLTPHQQQPLRRVLIGIAQQLLATLPHPTPPEDRFDERNT